LTGCTNLVARRRLLRLTVEHTKTNLYPFAFKQIVLNHLYTIAKMLCQPKG
jgi:hypothetical protein